MKDIDSKVGDEAREPGWKERLRAGDPAREADPLDSHEVQAMRRAMLGAVPEARRSGAWRMPLLAAAALAALAGLVVGLRSGWFSPGSGTPQGAPPQVVSVRPAPVPPTPPVAEEAPSPAPQSAREPAPSPRAPRGSRPGRKLRPAPAPDRGTVPQLASNPASDDAPLTAPAQARRELQFSTPGGTRIVWVFASGEATPSTPPLSSRL